MARVTVRAFAALREHIARPTEVEAASVADLVALLSREHGETFAARLARSQVVVGEERVALDDASPLPDGVEVVLLPPFSGG